MKGYKEREIRSSSCILDLERLSYRIRGRKKKARHSINCMFLGRMIMYVMEFIN